jgi:arylsulfatase A-like enzyme
MIELTTTSKPNILIFMTDQQRWDMAPPYNRAITPHLDVFYKNAVSFTQTYGPSPHCCPSRATFFTGLYPSQHGVWNNVNVGNGLSRGLKKGVRLWSDDLFDAGYKLYLTGKWHISAEEGPEDRHWIVTDGAKKASAKSSAAEWKLYNQQPTVTTKDIRQTGQILRPGYPLFVQYGHNENPYRDADKVQSAIQTIQERNDDEGPWCQYVGTLGPHDPYFVPQRFLDMYNIDDIQLPENFKDAMLDKPALYRRTKARFDQLSEEEHRKSILHYLAFCTYEDELFGMILEALEEKGQRDNTIILFTSDHGDYMGEHGLWTKGLPCFQSAYHVPMLIQWPQGAVQTGRTVEQYASLADVGPTLLEMAGVEVERNFAGRSLVPFLRNEQPANWRDAMFTQSNGNELYGIQRSVTTKEWKYVYNGFDFDELYHLSEDPDEMHNVIGDPQYQPIVQELCTRMWQFAYAHDDVCINPYIMVGHVPYGPGVAFQNE